MSDRIMSGRFYSETDEQLEESANLDESQSSAPTSPILIGEAPQLPPSLDTNASAASSAVAMRPSYGVGWGQGNVTAGQPPEDLVTDI